MTKRPDTPWTPIAPILALALAVVAVCATLVISGVMDFVFSFL